MDPITLSTAAVTALAPFTPYLLKIAASITESLSEKIATEGGEKAWEMAQSLWKFITQKLNPNGETEDAARVLARKPEDQNRQAMLTEVLVNQLTENPNLAQELVSILGGQESIQKIVAKNESLIENVAQSMEGKGGHQVVEATDKSSIRGVKQIKKE